MYEHSFYGVIGGVREGTHKKVVFLVVGPLRSGPSFPLEPRKGVFFLCG